MQDEAMSKRFCMALSVYAEIEGMKIANAERDMSSESACFGSEDFDIKAEELRVIASMHEDQF